MWLIGTNGASFFISENEVENITHFFFVCSIFRENFDLLWSSVETKILNIVQLAELILPITSIILLILPVTMIYFLFCRFVRAELIELAKIASVMHEVEHAYPIWSIW